MGDKLKTVIVFLAGLTIGSVATWRFAQTKWQKIADDEINEMKEYYSSKYGTCEVENISEEIEKIPFDIEEEDSEYEPTKEEVVDYTKIASKYSSKEEKPDIKQFVHTEDMVGPRVIDPEEFGDNEEYDCVELTYYANGYLVDDVGNLVRDVEEKIGWENLDRFGEYEPDALHIVNDDLKVYYEILRDLDDYKEE